MLKTRYVAVRKGYGALGLIRAYSAMEALQLARKRFSNPEGIYVEPANKAGKAKARHHPIIGSRSGLNR